MDIHCRTARGFGLSFFLGCLGLLFGLCDSGWAQSSARNSYPPNGPDIPTIKLNEGPSGAAGLPPLKAPPPNGRYQQSIWNMKVVGFADNQGRGHGDQIWIEDQNGRQILYTANGGDTQRNPVTGKVEQNGTMLYDVTDPSHPKFLHHIPAKGSASHVFVCGGDTLPQGQKGHYYMLRDRGTDSNQSYQIWDVTKPSAPFLLTTVVKGLDGTHKSWWECDTGIAYLIGDRPSDHWHYTGSKRRTMIYDMSNPKSPKFIRNFGLVGQQPAADVDSAKRCMNNPGPNCYEGVTNPPAGAHEVYSAGTKVNRVYIPYGTASNGVVQIVNREKLLNGCNASTASANCATNPTQDDLLYPQISYITMKPLQGAHDAKPIFGVPVPEEQSNFLDNTPQEWDLNIVTSEATVNNCHGQAPHNASLLDITNDKTPWPIATLDVPQFPGNFCAKGARFGAHHTNWQIYPPYYGKLAFVTFFNAGLRVWDIRDPLNPREVAYFIQGRNENTQESCGTYQGKQVCRKAPFMDIVEIDDRGYIYGYDRAGSGVTILKLSGEASKVVNGQGPGGHGRHRGGYDHHRGHGGYDHHRGYGGYHHRTERYGRHSGGRVFR